MTDPLVTVYVALLGEGTDVWRPVNAIHVRGDIFQLSAAETVPSDERWQFMPGELVRCHEETLSGEEKVLVAGPARGVG